MATPAPMPQYRTITPYLVVPDVTLQGAASSPRTQRLLLIALAAGLPVLVPSLVLLFRVFKSSRGERAPDVDVRSPARARADRAP